MGTSHRLIQVPAFGRLAYWKKMLRLDQYNLIGYWPLWEPSGVTVNDQSPVNNDAAYGGTVTLGQAGPDGGKCLQLAGAGYVNLYSAGLVSDFSPTEGTAAIWFKVAAGAWADGANRQILQLRADASNLVRFYKTTTNNQLILQYVAGGTQETFTLYMATTLWTHLALTWSKSAEEVRAYVNGLQVGPTSANLGAWAGALSNGNMYLGSINTTPNNPWIGYLAHAGLWKTPLSPAKIMRMVRPYDRLHPENGQSVNAADHQVTPTSDELGTATHPDIAYSAAGWNGYKYWLVMSPYPGEERENPEILASNDGDTWEVPEGLTNPIDATPAAGSYNSDPDLILGQDGSLYCFYREYVAATGTSAIKVRSSSDGVTWSAESEPIASNAGAWSPAVVWDGAQYVMFYCAANQTPRRIERRTAATPGGPWAAAVICPINYPVSGVSTLTEPWHIDVFHDGTRYVGLFTLVNQGASEYSSARLYLAFSEDGFVWRIADSPCLSVVAGAWDQNRIYRATGLPRAAGGYDIWYSALDGASGWHIGRTIITGV